MFPESRLIELQSKGGRLDELNAAAALEQRANQHRVLVEIRRQLGSVLNRTGQQLVLLGQRLQPQRNPMELQHHLK